MEEQRISAMYRNLWVRRLTGFWGSLFPRGLRRSPLLPGVVIAAMILGPAIGWSMHRHGQFGRAKRKIHTELNTDSAAYLDRPGGEDPIVLTRMQTPGTQQPEFLSATLLPGLGMSVLQITAYVPDRGVVPLLHAPSVKEMAEGLSDPPMGFNDDHGRLELPWGGELMGVTTPSGNSISVVWRDQAIQQSTESSAQEGVAEGGMLGSLSADHAGATSVSDGMKADALFTGVNGNGRWTSQSDVTVSAQLSGHAMELTVRAKNTGDHAEPMGVGWHPRFSLGNGMRDHVQIRLPGGDVMELSDHTTGLPSGSLASPGSLVQRFQDGPAEVGAAPLDETLVNLKPSSGASQAAAEVRFPEAGFGLRLNAASSTIKALRVNSPSGANYVSVGMQTNMDDPFGKEWTASGGGGMVTLEPGQELEWKVRLEIFAVPRQ